jgi:hypothetical protein
MTEANQTALPVIFIDDDDGDYSGQLIRGVRLKFVDKVWSAADGTPLHESDRYLAAGTGHAIQSWIDGLPEVITTRPLPDLTELNAAIPREQWPIGKFSGQPEAPWKHVWYVYLVRVSDGTMRTYINSTVGTKIAIQRLKERIKTMSVLRGVSVLPIVKLGWVMMPSAYGPRPRPDFVIDDWRDLGNQLAQIESPKQAEQIGTSVQPVSVEEEMNDSLPF